MEFIDGIEVGVGGYFDGNCFMQPACVDFEHKRFFPGDLGELTGEMGTVVTYDRSAKLRERVLVPLTEILRGGGYRGYINVNFIANDRGLWPLEFTSRFGYPGYAICEALHNEHWEQIFLKLARQSDAEFQTAEGFAVGIVLTVPPFPHTQGYSEISKGIPIILDEQMLAEERTKIAFAEVEMRHGTLVTSGTCGYVGVVTGCAPTIPEARESALKVASKVYVPNLRYRNDIGDRVSDHALKRLSEWDLL